MSVTLTGTGGLFTRVGLMAGGINAANTFRGSTLNTRLTNINNQFLAADQDLMSDLYTSGDSLVSSMSAWPQYLQTLSQSTAIQMVDEDSPLNSLTLTQALNVLITQMIASSSSINRPTLGATATAGSSNVGNGSLIASTIDGRGYTLDMLFQEDIDFVCSASGYQGGGGTSGSETFDVTSPASVDPLSELWPAGSGVNTSLTVFNPALTTGTIVTDGNFEAWQGTGNNTPTNWTIAVGTAGTQIFRSTDPYLGSYALQFTGDGSNLTAVRQNITSGLSPNTVYGWLLRAKTDGSVAAGVLNVRLLDQNFNVISDDQSTANSATQNVSALTSSYTAVSGFFRTPAVIPTQVWVEIRLSTAMTSTEVLLIDAFGFQEATQLYAGGPFVAMFAGSTNFSINDTFTLAMTNSLGVTAFCRALDRAWNLRENGFHIPSSGSPTISDSLIT